MSSTNVFKDQTAMPPAENDPDSVRVALTRNELRANLQQTAYLRDNNDVRNVKRPRYGHGY